MKQRREVWERMESGKRVFVEKYLKEFLGMQEKDFENFLFPEYEKCLLDPRAMHDMDKAVERILRAIVEEEKIAVYGDYDCDGVPGTAMMRDFFEKINYNRVVYYIPHRHTEGYGLNEKAIDILTEQGVSLIITIDLGTTNIKEIDYANKNKIDVIVTDHHLPHEEDGEQVLPSAYAIINNKKNICEYANKELCGSGTLFKLIQVLVHTLQDVFEVGDNEGAKKAQPFSLLHTLSSNFEFAKKITEENFKKVGVKCPQSGYEKWLLDLVAVATIADMMKLTDENRALVIYGLHVLSKTNRAGLQTLFKNAKTDLKKVTETDIGFTLAPRVNSASRMAHPKIALSMFSQNLEESINAAHELEDLNTHRKNSTNTTMKKIYKMLDERIAKSLEKKLPKILVIGSHDWNAGILGILAQKILEKYNVNVFVFGEDESDKNIFKGSCRSLDVHLVKLMSEVSEKFIHFGGHEMAGGFTVSFQHLHDLENCLNEKYENAKLVEAKKSEQQKFLDIQLSKIDAQILEALNLIGPFGVGNEKPVFKISGIQKYVISKFGKNKEHLKIVLKGENSLGQKLEREAVKFFVDENEAVKIEQDFLVNKIFFEIEPGWNTNIPRLRII